MFFRSIALTSLVLIGCSEGSAEKQAAQPGADTPAHEVFVSDRPADAPGIAEVKKSAAKGDTVRFLGRVGGKVESFVDGNSIFVASDPALPSCELMGEEDHCAVPWDYCCEDADDLLDGMATIRILDEKGRPIRASARGMGGLEESKYILVEGTVNDRNDEGVFIVDATSIWVGGKPTRADLTAGSK